MSAAVARRAAVLAAALLLGAPVGAVVSSSAEGGFERVIVTLRDDPGLSTAAGRAGGLAARLRAHAAVSQGRLRSFLALKRAEGEVRETTSLWIANALVVTATPEVIADLRLRSDVASVEPDAVIRAPSPFAALLTPEPGIELVNAPDLWGMGATGSGVVVASVDTGVELTHPDLALSWRGGTNSWFDPDGVYDSPTDRNGHGTATTGVMVGGDAGGTAIGVAPGARWIAAKIFDDNGDATLSDVHLAFQWLLDPDGDPSTDDAPDVVNASWTLGPPGCDLEFQPDLAVLRAAGIVPVFAAGNKGPGVGTSVSPANNPSALAVGATTTGDTVWSGSSRGPTTCGGSSGPFPELVAPGVSIRSADLHGGYAAWTGTSLAAPHVSGALALLMSAVHGSTAAEAEQALLSSAVDLSPAGSDEASGHGRLDLLGAYELLQEPLRLLSVEVRVGSHRVRVKVRHGNCDPCRARARLRLRSEGRRRLLDTSGNHSVGVFSGVSAGRWTLVVTARDVDTGRVVSAAPRVVRVR
jgi:subtilisin family serine protease